MALPVSGKVILDTNVFIDYLRADLHAEWVFGQVENTTRQGNYSKPFMVMVPVLLTDLAPLTIC
jgi:hypothetical protein